MKLPYVYLPGDLPDDHLYWRIQQNFDALFVAQDLGFTKVALPHSFDGGDFEAKVQKNFDALVSDFGSRKGTFTADTTLGSADLTNVSADDIDRLSQYAEISGTGIVAGSYVASTNAPLNKVTLSVAATATNAGVSLSYSTFRRPVQLPYTWEGEFLPDTPEDKMGKNFAYVARNL